MWSQRRHIFKKNAKDLYLKSPACCLLASEIHLLGYTGNDGVIYNILFAWTQPNTASKLSCHYESVLRKPSDLLSIITYITLGSMHCAGCNRVRLLGSFVTSGRLSPRRCWSLLAVVVCGWWRHATFAGRCSRLNWLLARPCRVESSWQPDRRSHKAVERTGSRLPVVWSSECNAAMYRQMTARYGRITSMLH
jgi:hypothetical protein